MSGRTLLARSQGRGISMSDGLTKALTKLLKVVKHKVWRIKAKRFMRQFRLPLNIFKKK